LVECDLWQKCDWFQKSLLGHHLRALSMLITMVQFPASYRIHILRHNAQSFLLWIHRVRNGWAMYYARYLGLGMRYGAGICTIVISMNGAFKWCPFCCKLNFDPKLWKTMDYSLWSSAIFGKNMIDIKIHFYDIVWKFFSCWSQSRNSQLHISFTYSSGLQFCPSISPHLRIATVIELLLKWAMVTNRNTKPLTTPPSKWGSETEVSVHGKIRQCSLKLHALILGAARFDQTTQNSFIPYQESNMPYQNAV